MSKYAIVMLGGIGMTGLSGGLLMWWLALNTGSGIVGLLFIMGMVAGVAVFIDAASSAIRAPDPQVH